MDRHVNARIIKDIDDKLSRFYGTDELMASEYSTKGKHKRGSTFEKLKSSIGLGIKNMLEDEEPDMRKQWLELR